MGLLDAPLPPPKKEQGRIHRLRDDDEPQEGDGTVPRIQSFVSADAEGNLITARGEPAMPKGIYNRKPRGEKPAQEAIAQPRKPGRKARAVALVPEVAKRGANGSEARFDVSLDLRAGAVTINAAKGSLTLAPDEVLALFAFLGRR